MQHMGHLCRTPTDSVPQTLVCSTLLFNTAEDIDTDEGAGLWS